MNRDDFVKIYSNCYLSEEKIKIGENGNFKEIITILKEEYRFDVLKQIIGIDNQSEGIELVYHLFNTEDEENLYLSHTVLNEAETVADIFKSAVADENEIYDLFGVNFTGNENLKRLYLPQSWQGYPLKKDYVQDDTRLVWNDDDEIKA